MMARARWQEADTQAGSGRMVATTFRRRRCPREDGVMVISACGGAVVMDRATECNGIPGTHTATVRTTDVPKP
jgi:hypothetical protein